MLPIWIMSCIKMHRKEKGLRSSEEEGLNHGGFLGAMAHKDLPNCAATNKVGAEY